MADLLISKSAVEKRRIARKNIAIAVIVVFFSLIFISLSGFFRIVGFLGIAYAIYKGVFNGVLSLWINKE